MLKTRQLHGVPVEKLGSHCLKCGFRVRGAAHSDGQHHKHGKLGKTKHAKA